MKKIIYLISVVVFLFIYGCTQPTNTPQQITSSEQGTAIQKREQRFFSTIPYAHWTPHQENIPIELLENYTVSYEYTGYMNKYVLFSGLNTSGGGQLYSGGYSFDFHRTKGETGITLDIEVLSGEVEIKIQSVDMDKSGWDKKEYITIKTGERKFISIDEHYNTSNTEDEFQVLTIISLTEYSIVNYHFS